MRFAKVIGTVTLNRSHPSFAGATLKLAVPLSLDNLTGKSTDEGETFVLYDQLSAGIGDVCLVSDGGEAAQPFKPELKPVDAYNSALIDYYHIAEERSDEANGGP